MVAEGGVQARFQKGPQIYLIEPSGLFYEYKAWAVGKHRQAAKTEIEKLKLDSLSMQQLVKEAVRILITVRDESKDKNLRIEMGWVGKQTGGKHQVSPVDALHSPFPCLECARGGGGRGRAVGQGQTRGGGHGGVNARPIHPNPRSAPSPHWLILNYDPL